MKQLLGTLLVLIFFTSFSSAWAQEVDILWQGDTYTPPFYEGRALWSHQSRITLVAIPHGLGNPAGLDYKWTKNGTVLGNVGGVGRNSISFVDSVLSRPQTIKVEILAPDKSILATNSVFVEPRAPLVVVYENNPLYGFMFHRAVEDSYKLEKEEVSFTAFPIFFSVSGRASASVGYRWTSNAGGTDVNNSVTYRSPTEGSGSARITVRAESRDTLLQSATKNLLIQFGNNNNI